MARPKFLPPAAALEEVQRTSANVENAKGAVDVRELCGGIVFSFPRLV